MREQPVALLLVVVGLATMFAACGGDDTEPVAVATPATTTPTTPPIATTAPAATPTPAVVDLSYQDTIDTALAQLASYWAEQMPVLFGIDFDPIDAAIPYQPSDATTIPSCGPATMPPEAARNQAFYCPDEDYIAWDDEGFFPDTYTSNGDIAVAVIIAHEYAHAVQARIQVAAPAVVFELQADCFAGAWTGSLARDEPNGLVVTDDDLARTIASHIRLRDAIGTRAADPGAHGSGFDRLAAFADGFDEGPGSCATYHDDWPEIAELLIEPGYGETEGDKPIDELVRVLIEDLDNYWTVAQPGFEPPAEAHGFSKEDRPQRCGTRPVDPDLVAATGYYCRADDTIEVDADAQAQVWETSGDAAATYGLVHAYTQAVVSQTTTITDPAAAVLAADCLAGVWARHSFDDLKAYEDDADYEPTHLLWFSAGDLDEMLVGINLTPPLAPDAVDPGPIGPFQRTNAFGDGFFDGPATCTAT